MAKHLTVEQAIKQLQKFPPKKKLLGFVADEDGNITTVPAESIASNSIVGGEEEEYDGCPVMYFQGVS